MKHAIDLIETPLDLIRGLVSTNRLKRMAKALFRSKLGYTCWVRMTKEGEFYLHVGQLSGIWGYSEWNPDILALDCGWDLEFHLQDDEYYYEDQETGQWGIEGWEDPFEYLWFTGELTADLERVLISAFENAKMNRIIDEL